ncbi:hypothetical protein BDQ17DRAFT_1413185 [Cyathus striatus]|nr:hypothetical protein BDQ17DRAFT_1413185 [Cyathus striatus]
MQLVSMHSMSLADEGKRKRALGGNTCPCHLQDKGVGVSVVAGETERVSSMRQKHGQGRGEKTCPLITCKTGDENTGKGEGRKCVPLSLANWGMKAFALITCEKKERMEERGGWQGQGSEGERHPFTSLADKSNRKMMRGEDIGEGVWDEMVLLVTCKMRKGWGGREGERGEGEDNMAPVISKTRGAPSLARWGMLVIF